MATVNNKRVTISGPFSKETLTFLDEYVDGITLSAQHSNFEGIAKIIGTAKREIAAELVRFGGVPLSVQRET